MAMNAGLDMADTQTRDEALDEASDLDLLNNSPDLPELETGSGGFPAWDEAAITEEIIAALRTVLDPEIPVNIYDLGLIYRINLLPPFGVEIDMTLTAPGCPVASELVSMVQRAVLMVPKVDVATVKLVFDPPWDTSRLTEEVKLELGLL